MEYSEFVKKYFTTSFIPSVEGWGESVLNTLKLFDKQKNIVADVTYDFIKNKLKRHITSYELLLQETYDSLFEEANELNIDLGSEQLIPPAIWVLVKDKVEVKLDTLFQKITDELTKYQDAINAAPDDVKNLIEDLKAITSVDSDQIWRLLNTVMKDD